MYPPGSFGGLANEMTFFNGIPQNFTYLMEHIDDLGSDWGYNHYPVGWAHGEIQALLGGWKLD